MHLKAIKDVLSNSSTIVLLKCVTFATGVFIARELGPSERGVYVYLVLMSSVGLQISFFGIGNSIQYYTSKGVYNAKETTFINILLGLIHGIFVVGVIITLWSFNLLGKTAQDLTLYSLIPLFIQLPLNGVFFVIKFQLIGLSRFHRSNILQIIQVVSFALFISTVFFIHGLEILGCLWSLILSQSIVTVYALFMVRKNISITLKIQNSIKYLKDLYSYGLKAWLGNISSRANDSLDQFILGFVASSSQLGVYSVAYTIVNLLSIPSTSITPILFNFVTKKSEKSRDSFNVTMQVHKFLFWMQVCFAIILYLIGDKLILFFFGSEYSETINVMYLLVPGIVLYNSTRSVSQKYLAAIGKPLKTSNIQFVGAIIGLTCYILLIPKYGVEGAAIGSTFGYVGSSIMALYFVKSEDKKNNIIDFFILRKSDFYTVKNFFSLVLKKKV